MYSYWSIGDCWGAGPSCWRNSYLDYNWNSHVCNVFILGWYAYSDVFRLAEGRAMRKKAKTTKQFLVRFLVQQEGKRDVTRRLSTSGENLLDAQCRLAEDLSRMFPKATRIVIYNT